ncbi:MAG: hypothetical protein ABI741_00655 [Ferruginibacter sp.]
MTVLFKPAVIAISILTSVSLMPVKIHVYKAEDVPSSNGKTSKKIQAAVLLDVSNSMDGLIEQAKAQLWNMVSVMGKAKCDNGTTPEIEISLYEYGRSNNDVKSGFVKQISGFTTDLDQLSQKLFSLTTNGGDEYCGQVIYTSLKDLNWDLDTSSYKVIFIAGNEDFLQGSMLYTKACDEAKKKGVIVNTIYCGDRMQGIKEHWNLNAECGDGSFTNINQDAKIEDIPTPYDSVIFALNDTLNTTYLTFGAYGASGYAAQSSADKKNYEMNKSVAVKRVSVKGKKELYKNSTWDMVDAIEDDKDFADKVDLKTLPDSMKTKSRKEIKEIIVTKSAKRTKVQKDIETVNAKREVWLSEERKKKAVNNNTATLESEIEKIIKKQAKRFNMVIK